jgi:hypothetical protein
MTVTGVHRNNKKCFVVIRSQRGVRTSSQVLKILSKETYHLIIDSMGANVV